MNASLSQYFLGFSLNKDRLSLIQLANDVPSKNVKKSTFILLPLVCSLAGL